MAIGFVLLDGTTVTAPDKGLTRNSSPRTLVARFGDGYEQRLVDGINNISETFSIAFVNRTKAEIDDITAFFAAKGGATSFDFTIPDTNSVGNEKTIKVVCENYSQNYSYDGYYGCTANFRRVYEA